MFANQQALDRPSLEKYAQELGLDLAKFKAAMDDAKLKERLEADKKQAAQFGATGTPTFFVNGRKMVGAQPFDAFKTVIDEEMKKADDKLKAGVTRANLYAALTKDGLDKAAPPPAPPGAPNPDTVFKADVRGAPSKGPKDALITIVAFSEFQCPFCARVEPTLDKVMETYPGKIRLVWRDFPLPFHQDATPAAIVARVAGEQGKFWEMHDKLFENQRKLDRASLEQYAQELGLNVAKVEAALDEKKYESQIKADLEMGQKIGVRGTPAFFINGTFLSGAQPFEAFKARIDQQLAKAEALVKKGVVRSKLYDTIMKTAETALAVVPAAGRPAGGGEPGPEDDQTVFKVAAGKLALPGTQKRSHHGDPVLGLPVPLLLAGRALHHPAREGLPRQDPGGLEGLSPRLSPERPPGGGRRPRGRGRGQVLADARQAVREPAGPRAFQPGEIRRRSSGSTWPSSGPPSTAASSPPRSTPT